MKQKGITVYLNKKDYEVYLHFKKLVRQDERYSTISNYFRFQMKKYIKTNIK